MDCLIFKQGYLSPILNQIPAFGAYADVAWPKALQKHANNEALMRVDHARALCLALSKSMWPSSQATYDAIRCANAGIVW